MTNLMIASPIAANQPVQHEGIVMLLLHEALARSRMREAEQAARDYALARALRDRTAVADARPLRRAPRCCRS